MFDAAGPVLGIDPGVSRCGYGAVARGSGGALVAQAFGVIRTELVKDLELALCRLEPLLRLAIKNHG